MQYSILRLSFIMPLPIRIQEKRAFDPTAFLERVKEHQLVESDDDSLEATLKVVDSAMFMTTYPFQRFLNSLPMCKAQRELSERNYMRAVLNWRLSNGAIAEN